MRRTVKMASFGATRAAALLFLVFATPLLRAEEPSLRQAILDAVLSATGIPTDAAPETKVSFRLLPSGFAIPDPRVLRARGESDPDGVVAKQLSNFESTLKAPEQAKVGKTDSPASPKSTPEPEKKSILGAIGDKLGSDFSTEPKGPELSEKGKVSGGAKRIYYPPPRDWSSDNGWTSLASRSPLRLQFSYKTVLIQAPLRRR